MVGCEKGANVKYAYAVIANNNADEISQQISNNEVMHLREQNKTDQQNAAGISRICMLVLFSSSSSLDSR